MAKPKNHDFKRYLSSDFVRLLITIVIVALFIFLVQRSERHYRFVEHWLVSASTISPEPAPAD